MDTATKDSLPENLIDLTAKIVSAFVGSQNNTVSANDIPNIISSVHSALHSLGSPVAPQVRQEPAVSVRSSIKPDYIVCLEDGAKLKMLKRYIMTRFQMTPDQYRAKWGLSSDYPMTAPNYAEQRRSLAKKIGLGTIRSRGTEVASKPKVAKAPKTGAAPRRGRPKGSLNKPKLANA